MNAEGRREAAAAGLEKLAAWVREGGGPLPSPAWPLVFQAGSGADLRALAASLGHGDAVPEELAEEGDGWPWDRLRFEVGAVPVEFTADAGPVLADELPLAVTS